MKSLSYITVFLLLLGCGDTDSKRTTEAERRAEEAAENEAGEIEVASGEIDEPKVNLLDYACTANISFGDGTSMEQCDVCVIADGTDDKYYQCTYCRSTHTCSTNGDCNTASCTSGEGEDALSVGVDIPGSKVDYENAISDFQGSKSE